MAFLHNQFLRRISLSLILAWGILAFILVSSNVLLELILISVMGIVCLIFIWMEISPIFILIFLSFTSSYAFYVFLNQLSLPIWLVMIAILVIFGFLFTYTEQKIGILGNKRLIYLVLFSIIILEVFLVLSYFLINPISQSLVIATTSYLFVGFCYTVLAKHTDNKFSTYALLTAIVIALIFLTSNWGGLV